MLFNNKSLKTWKLYMEIRKNLPVKRTSYRDSSGVYICYSIVNHLRHGNYICKSEGIYLTYVHRIEIPVEFTYVIQ